LVQLEDYKCHIGFAQGDLVVLGNDED